MANRFRRTLVLHADDFGMSPSVNAGVVKGFTDGLLTATSVLSNGPAFEEALQLWRTLEATHQAGRLASAEARRILEGPSRPLELGVHLNLTQGRPLTRQFPAELLDSQGRFPGIFGLARRLWRTRRRHQAAMRGEFEAQIERVFDHGLVPTHVNGHQYVEMLPQVSEVLPGVMARFGISTCRLAKDQKPRFPRSPRCWPNWTLGKIKRSFAERFGGCLARAEILHPDAFRGTMHAGRIDLRVMRSFVNSTHCGMTEIALHPGESPAEGVAAEGGWQDPLAQLRPVELAMLTSTALIEFLEGAHVRLGRFAELSSPKPSPARAVRTA